MKTAMDWYDGGLIDIYQRSFWLSAATIFFNPLFWNIVARKEYKSHFLTRLCGGAYRGCYVLAFIIFSIGLIRDNLFHAAIQDQPRHPWLSHPQVKTVATILFATGGILVSSSMWALGVTGTYLGDYFGIYMDKMVTGFPFNLTSSPMYNGSTMTFLSTALWYESPAGILLTLLVFLVYKVALRYEDPFTTEIYRKRYAKTT